MKKTAFRIFAVLMIIGLLLGTMAPFLLSLGSLNSSNATSQEKTAD